MAAKTPMVVVLTDGEQIHGWIEWYDKHCLKVNRERGPNLLIPKASIKYLYKESEGERGAGAETGRLSARRRVHRGGILGDLSVGTSPGRRRPFSDR